MTNVCARKRERSVLQQSIGWSMRCAPDRHPAAEDQGFDGSGQNEVCRSGAAEGRMLRARQIMTDPLPLAIPGIAGPAQAARASSATIDGVFRRAFRVFADRIAVVSEDKSWTYGALGERSWRLANALGVLGLKRGDRIAVLCETRPEYVEIYAACAAVGVTVVALNIRLHPDELLHCLEKGRPSLLMSSGPLACTAAALRAEAPYV